MLHQTRSCQRAKHAVTDENLPNKNQKWVNLQIAVYSRQLSQLEQIIVHFGVYWLTLRLASSPFTLSLRAAISAPRRATCSGCPPTANEEPPCASHGTRHGEGGEGIGRAQEDLTLDWRLLWSYTWQDTHTGFVRKLVAGDANKM